MFKVVNYDAPGTKEAFESDHKLSPESWYL